MGQATLDLPDPTQLAGVNAGPLSPEALASADDLLSQLAGDDIDRLLAEADADRPAAAASPPATDPVIPAVPPTSATAEASPLAGAAEVAATATVPTSAQALASDEAATAAAIDAILGPAIESTIHAVEKQIETAEPPAAPPSAAPDVVPQAASPVPSSGAVDHKLLDDAAAHVASIMDVPIAEPEPAAVADSAERQALSEPLILPQSTARSRNYLWPLVAVLELINSPMDFFSDEVREAMGKVAIVTTFNAAAVLVYVMVFRRPHH